MDKNTMPQKQKSLNSVQTRKPNHAYNTKPSHNIIDLSQNNSILICSKLFFNIISPFFFLFIFRRKDVIKKQSPQSNKKKKKSTYLAREFQSWMPQDENDGAVLGRTK